LGFCFLARIAHAQDFPKDYFGIYKGDLQMQSAMGKQVIPMEFHLLPTDSIGRYKYILVYGDGERRQERLYFLVEKDKDKGRYVIDEDNGILLEASYFGNKLYCLFEVSGNLLTTFITFEEESLNFEITVAKLENPLETKDLEEGIPVISYPIFTRQWAVLIKQ